MSRNEFKSLSLNEQIARLKTKGGSEEFVELHPNFCSDPNCRRKVLHSHNGTRVVWIATLVRDKEAGEYVSWNYQENIVA